MQSSWKWMGKSTQPFANPKVQGKYPVSALKVVIYWIKLPDFHLSYPEK